MKLVGLKCPSCGATFRRDEYVVYWDGSEEAFEDALRAALSHVGLSCIECNKSVDEFLTVWSEDE